MKGLYRAAALITPTLFSRPPPNRREKREKFVGKSRKAPLSRTAGGRRGERGWGVRAAAVAAVF
jgi:hypothetical protein